MIKCKDKIVQNDENISLFSNVLKSGTMIIFLIQMFRPHVGRTDPVAAFAVKGFVDYHRLQRFRMLGNGDEFVFHTFKVAVSAGFQFHNILLMEKRRDDPGA